MGEVTCGLGKVLQSVSRKQLTIRGKKQKTILHMHVQVCTSLKQFRGALSKKHEVDCCLAMIIKQRAKKKGFIFSQHEER